MLARRPEMPEKPGRDAGRLRVVSAAEALSGGHAATCYYWTSQIESAHDPSSAVLAALLLLLFARPLAAFDGIRLTLLGGAEQSAQDEPVGPGILVEAGDELLLFDCGVGSLARLRERTIPAARADGSIPDQPRFAHTSAVAPSCWPRGFVRARSSRCRCGDQGAPFRLCRLGSVRDGAAESEGIDPHEIGENLVYDSDDVRVTAIVADYPTRFRAYGYRVDRERRAVALLAGAGYSENVAHGARGAQVVVSDVAAAAGQEAAAEPGVRASLGQSCFPGRCGKNIARGPPVPGPVLSSAGVRSRSGGGRGQDATLLSRSVADRSCPDDRRDPERGADPLGTIRGPTPVTRTRLSPDSVTPAAQSRARNRTCLSRALA